MPKVVISIAFLFFLGHALKWFFIRTKVPDLLILVCIGYLIGPILGLISQEDLGKVGGFLSIVALVVILYEGGLGLKGKDLLQSTLPAAGLSLVGFFLICGVTIFFTWLFAGHGWTTAILLGLAVGSTSSAVVIPMVKHLSISEKTKTILSLESAFTDVLAIVLFLVAVDSVSSGSFSAQKLLEGIGPATLLSIIYGLSAGILWAWLRNKFPELSAMAFASESWALLVYGLVEISRYNGAMAVLALGFSLANLNLLPGWAKKFINPEAVSLAEQSLLAEITLLIKTLFFIYLGILVSFDSLPIVALALLIAVMIFVTRWLAIRLLFNPKQYNRKEAMICMAMGPRGLACAVLATIPLQRGLENGLWIQNTLFALIPISILFTAAFVFVGENKKIRGKLYRLFPAFRDREELEAATFEGNDETTLAT